MSDMISLKVVSIRLKEEQPLISEEVICNPEDAVKIVGKEIKNWDRECLCVVNLTTKGKPINMNIVSIGTINGSLVSGRELFKSAILSNAATMIILHNHPSGDPSPSREDILVTEKMIQAGELLNIQVLDHIIIGGDKFYSMRAENVIDINDRIKIPSTLSWNKDIKEYKSVTR